NAGARIPRDRYAVQTDPAQFAAGTIADLEEISDSRARPSPQLVQKALHASRGPAGGTPASKIGAGDAIWRPSLS
ncbi:MAG: hypothetical protein MUE60_13985, partial [Candidatus Eisenbacteria bacterium]|nr:hypothetical protein [Candidatus Eisenbacteria bacterium]